MELFPVQLFQKLTVWNNFWFARTAFQVSLNYANHAETFCNSKNCRFFSLSAASECPKKSTFGVFKRLRYRANSWLAANGKIPVSTCKVYERLADEIRIDEFFHYFNLPDTFESWFLVIQLHMWLCIVRTFGENHGRLFRNKLIEVMWSDVEERLRQLKGIQPSVRKESLRSMTDQFRAALISYDEGFFSSDKDLAGAIWRTIFNCEYKDPRLLEVMVYYIRKQMSHLDTLNTEDIMLNGSLYWLPLKDIIQEMDLQR